MDAFKIKRASSGLILVALCFRGPACGLSPLSVLHEKYRIFIQITAFAGMIRGNGYLRPSGLSPLVA